MEDLDYDSKFNDMQKYIPFLDRVIEKLKNSDQDKPRKAQLEKMQTLHSLLHNKEKKMRIETLLKCETVLKKLHGKIDKSDDVIPSKSPSNSTTTSISSNAAIKVHTTTSASSPTPNTKNKFVPNNNIIEIHTCPASPTHLGEEDFRPPVVIPTERRSSPVKLVSCSRWDQQISSKEMMDEELTRTPMINNAANFQNLSTDAYNSSYTNSHHTFSGAPKTSRRSDPRDRTRDISPSSSSSSSSSFHRTAWSSSSIGFSSNNIQRSQIPKRHESKYSSEEENWDEPEKDTLSKPKLDPKPSSSSTLTSSSYSTHKDSKRTHHHRHHDNNMIEHVPPAPAFRPLPNANHSQDAFQSKLYHDTIYNYKKSEGYNNNFMNPPAPETRSQNNIFNRLGEKIDGGFENFQIHVRNDKIKAKPQSKAVTQKTPPPPPPPFLVSTKPIGEVLKSPPLSADDIDDLLNESLEAALVKQNKSKSSDFPKDSKAQSLDAVRKKLALISRPASPPRLESPKRVEYKTDEPFYRRGQTPTKKHEIHVQKKKNEIQISSMEISNPPLPPTVKNPPLPSPQSPPNAMDAVVERLALKYHPHKRRQSVSAESNFQLQNEKPNASLLQLKDAVDSLNMRSTQSSHRESIVSPVHTADPRIPKINHGPIQPLMSLPVPPVPNVLPTINHFDPRLRNTQPLIKDHSVPFTVPKPFYTPIPSLLDLHINIPINPGNVSAPSLPTYNVLSPKPKPKPARIDPRTHIPSKTYADKFNPERNDKTERMKYLESKKNKPPEPKTYGEYRQSKCRKQHADSEDKALNTAESTLSPVASSIQSMVPSTLDKMYRSADYGKDIATSIQGFKIPKKSKPDPTKDNSEEETKRESADSADPTAKKNTQKLQEDITKTSEDHQLESKLNETPKSKEKLAKRSDANSNKIQDIEPIKMLLPETKKKKAKTISHLSENPPVEVEKAQNKIPKTPPDEEGKHQTLEIDSQMSSKAKTKVSEPEPDELNCNSQNPDPLDDSVTESRLIIDEGESPIKSKDEKTKVVDETENSPEVRVMRPRRSKNVIKDNTFSPELKTKEHPNNDNADAEKELNEPEREEVNPRRIITRRSTILMKEPPEQIETKDNEIPAEIDVRRRSASDIFSPTTDNSVVSTQNIITGKRKTRASINFNEKNTKKTPTPKAVTSTAGASPMIQTTPITRAAKAAVAKQAARKRNSISVEQRKDDEEKKNSEDGQICAVSSTTEGPHTEPAIICDTITSPEEPSSSNATDQTSTPPRTVDADNKTKHEFLEGFLMSMADPTANKDRILDMLKSVLDDTKLQQVKDILYSPAKSNTKNTPGKKDEEAEEEEHHEQSKPRAPRTKKNELDRLNEDIRDMFICQGVVTATGRRMCTIAKATSNTTSVQPKKKKVVSTKPNKSPVNTTQPASLLNKRRMRKAKVIISPLNIRALRSRNQKQNRSPKMPVLQPNTPIKLSCSEDKSQESDEEMEETTFKRISTKDNQRPAKLLNKNLKNRPGPKSKRLPSDDSDSSDDDIELVFLKDKIKRKDEMRIEEKKKELKVDKTPEIKETKSNLFKEKGPDIKSKDKSKIETEVISGKCETADTVKDKKAKVDSLEILPKNTNPEFHTKSDFSNCCVICKEKARFISRHYLTAHNDSEVYTSRLPPDVLKDIKLNINNHSVLSLPKKHQAVFNYTCPFCDYQGTHTLRAWIDHFAIHTGEYKHKCSKCFRAMNGVTHMMDHIKKYCPDAKKINRDPIILQGNGIFGYVCHLCNFTQMLRGGVVKHLKVHHGLDDAKSIESIIQVKLIDEAEAAKKEEPTEVSSSSLTDVPISDQATVVEIKPSDPSMATVDSKNEDISMQIDEDDVRVLSGLSATTNSKHYADKKKTNEDDDTSIKKPRKESSMPINSNLEVFESPVTIDLTEQSQLIRDELQSGVNEAKLMSVESKNKRSAVKPRNIEVNIEVFLPRERLASPTTMSLSERWKSMEKDVESRHDSVVCKTKPVAKKMTIAEKLSQRFKNIEKQNIAEEKEAIADKNKSQTTEKDSNNVCFPVQSTNTEEEVPETLGTSEEATPQLAGSISPVSSKSLNESGNLIIDEQVQNKSTNRDIDNCSESDDGNENNEEDNCNWEDIEITGTVEDEKPKEDSLEILPKNTNPEFHTKSDFSNCCVICNEKDRFISRHYRTAHNDSEVYSSRLPPDVLEDIKLNINNRALFSLPKKPQAVFNYTCPFCDYQGTHTLRAWIDHFAIHTGEYKHKCSQCYRAMNGVTHMMDHIKKYCPDAKKINRDPIILNRNGIFGYVCHLCNFIQMLRGGVVQHLKVHHDLDNTESIKSIIEVKLIDTADVGKKEELADASILDPPTAMASTPSDPSMATVDSKMKEVLMPVQEDDVIMLSGSSATMETDEDDDKLRKKPRKKSNMSIDSNLEVFDPSDLASPVTIDLTERSEPITDELQSGVREAKLMSVESKNKGNGVKQRNIEVNIEVFLPRERLASPTNMSLSERWKSMEKDVESGHDSVVCKTKPVAKKMTIAEKLSQRFKNIEKQNIAEEKEAIADKNNSQTTEKDSINVCFPVQSTNTEEEVPETLGTSEKATPQLARSISPVSSKSLNESGNLIIDEQVQNESTNTHADYCSESDDGNENEEDDNDNWEDIEITETTKNGSQKEKNKNKSIFQTLSRLYASIAPKKNSKKIKEKEKEKKKQGEALEKSEKTSEKVVIVKTNPNKSIADESVDPLLLPTSSRPTQQSQHQEQQTRFPNMSEFLPDSPGDSLDMLLSANFNCLEGDGTSFPHLDLNDLDSSIFPLPEEQENIQDAIHLATSMENIKYDVLGNPIPLSSKPQQQQLTSFLPPTTTSIHKIGNFGFSLNGNSLKYYCMVNSCAFLFSDHPDGLQNHFILEHPTLKWNGYCDTCKMQVGFGDYCREMQHMLDVHSRIRTEECGDKPRIKFRRLTGDILSTDNQRANTLGNDVQFSPFKNVSADIPLFYEAPPQIDATSSTVSTPPSHNPISKTTASHTIPASYTPELSLSTMLQSEPKAMIPPKAPPKHDMDIPLFKNVSKEFTITNVAEGVTDNELLNLVFKQADSAPGGIQISQVISLNAGGKSVSPISLTQLSDRIAPAERRNSPALKEKTTTIRETEKPIPMNSPFVCCVNKCRFTTNIRSAMSEHILTHIRCDNNRDALKCNMCSFVGEDTNKYFNHMTQLHSRRNAVATSSASTVELTQKIQDILRTTSRTKQINENEETSQVQKSVAVPISVPVSVSVTEPDPVKVPVPVKVPLRVEEKTATEKNLPFLKRLRKTAEEIIAPTGLSEEEMWRCIFYPDCECPVLEKDFQTHLATHTSIVPTSFPSISPGSSLHCPHCPVNYYRAAGLKAHMKIHARHQYFCCLCSCTTFSNYQQVQKHFTEQHSLAGAPRTQNMIPGEKLNNPALFLASAKELTSKELIQFGEKLMGDWERRKALNKTHFKPNEQNLLPIQPIFNNQVYCSVCNYKTKVRTNMFRHLQLHNQDVDVGSVDPVNPVPCLEKNEKHFDKMLNLACSSNTVGTMKPKENVKIPVFVPDMRRFVCGQPGCKYLTITDQMLRSHLNALHGQEKGYLCPHCQEEICKKNMCAERVVQHLKFHGNKIYQCNECDYFHYTKHVVERHVNEKHAGVSLVNLVTYDRSENETKKSTQPIAGKNAISSHLTSSENDSAAESPATTSTPPNNKMKWECALCKHQTTTWNQMISHANSMHNAKHQYHCVHCTFGSAHLAHIMDHIDNKHPSKIREAKYVFYKINETPQDKAADTRPLWTRNDPKRVRSIRGILMENEEDAERTKKSLTRAGVDLDDEDEEIIAPASDLDATMVPGGLACFHCNFTSPEISSLNQHWKTKHWHEKNREMVPRLPFFFKMHTSLKCPLCPHVGDQITLKIHLINVHGHRNFCATDPNLPNTCGHCPFVYPNKKIDVLTNHYLRAHKPTDAKNLSSGLLRNLLALGDCQVYMQCYFCAEICADKTSIIEHERERHKNSNLRYKQIKDEVIYRCGMCQYSSTNELATLRHMIDHFAGFNICHFCKNIQSNFNSYMQHCYTFHKKSLTSFKEIYSFDKITSFLGQMLLIFPNGLIAAKRNLLDTQYGNTERMQAMYDEICKKALEPPIPPLCMGRLLAKKSIEASTLLPPPPVAVTAKRIAKRRSTVAMGGCEPGLSSSFLAPSEPQKIKKRKSSICGDFQQPTAPLFSTITANSKNVIDHPTEHGDTAEWKSSEPQGFSFYGQKSDPIDLSKIYTHIAIGDKFAPVSVKKFSLLFKINTKVVVEAMDFQNYYSKKRPATFSRACPASKKKKFV